MSERRHLRTAAPRTIAAHLRTLVYLCWALLLVVGAAAVGSLAVQSQNIHRLTLVVGPAVDANNELSRAMASAQTGLDAYQTTGDRALLQPYLGTYDRSMAALAALQARLPEVAAGRAEATRYEALGERQRLAVRQWWADALRTELALARGERVDLFENRALFDRYTSVSATLEAYLVNELARSRLAARTIPWQGATLGIGSTLVALLLMLLLGGRVARSISRPLIELRDTMVRQRNGDLDARAREDRGSLELRSVARDFNSLTEQNLALRQTQTRDLGTHQVTLDAGRAIRAAADTQETLQAVCATLGVGLGADRVMAHTMGAEQEVLLSSEWHGPAVQGLAVPTVLGDLRGVAPDRWLSSGLRAQDDLLAVDEPLQEICAALREKAGARAAITVPIGFEGRELGMIYVVMVDEPRVWTIAETDMVRAVSGFVAMAIVETEQQEYQREYVSRIDMLDRQKSDFLATVSHELRTPLTSISGYLEVLQGQEAGGLTAQQQRMLEVIGRNANRLRALIENVMVLSRIEGGVSEANFGEVSIALMITRVTEELSVVASGGSIELEVDAVPQMAVVWGDFSSLERALVNVLSNAIKFSRPGGAVTVTTSVDQQASRVLITCQDHGVGIPAEDQQELFTRFFRASNAMEQAIPGTGLGLSIAKQIIEEHHGGQLRITSIEGEGTTVVIELPMFEPMHESSQVDGVAVRDSSGGEAAWGETSAADEAMRNDSAAEGVFGIRA